MRALHFPQRQEYEFRSQFFAPNVTLEFALRQTPLYNRAITFYKSSVKRQLYRALLEIDATPSNRQPQQKPTTDD